jgi:hypothetical protein
METAPERPPRGAEAFTVNDDEGVQAQAAILLGLGAQLRGDRQKVQARSAAVLQPTAILMADEMAEFPIPRVAPATKRLTTAEVDVISRGKLRAPARAAIERPDVLADLADLTYRTRSVSSAATLADAALNHPHPLVQVAAANAALAVTAEPSRPLAILVEHTRSEDELVRDVAATSLGRYMPEHPALRALVGAGMDEPLGSPGRTSMLIHGTWARNNAWYQPPNGDFWSYVDHNVRNDLYSQPDFYRWSGGYSDGARDLAADELATWINTKQENGITLFTHSHGGSVAMLASFRGVTFDELVLLSCPVHPAKYNVNFSAVRKVVSIRVKVDLVLLADGSGSRFTDARYNEHVLPLFFNHSKTHDPATWTRFNIPAML